MGAVFTLRCPKCRYKSIWEMWVAHAYRRKHNTFEEIDNGIWGKELQELSKKEDCFINIDEVMFVCDACRAIDVRPSLAYRMRVRKLNYLELPIDGKEAEQVLKTHMKQDYTDWVRYKHVCDKCNVQMREVYNPEEEGPIHCPKCGEKLAAKFSGVS